MIFYLARTQKGTRLLYTRKDEAAKVDKDYQTLDIAPTKEAMMEAIQELLTDADIAKQLLEEAGVSAAPVAAPEPVSSAGKCDPRCAGCHRELVATVEGAMKLGIGEDMSFLGEWIQDAPDWVIPKIHEALREREARNT
jgi:hypothetical protein